MVGIRDVTVHVVDCLMLDIWPRAAAIVDFGITTQDHLAALQFAIKHGRTIADFDEAIGSGDKLTELCRVPGQPYVVQFEDPWGDD